MRTILNSNGHPPTPTSNMALNHFDREFREEALRLEREYSIKFLSLDEEEAMKKGEAIGEARGEARGMALGEANGSLRTKQDDIEIILRARLPDVSVELISRVRDIEDLTQLDEILVRAALARNTAEFVAALG